MMPNQSDNSQPSRRPRIEPNPPTKIRFKRIQGERTDRDVAASSVRIKVIGVGGCGRIAVEHVIRGGLTDLECFIADASVDAVYPALDEIAVAITGAQILCIVAGLGGRTGGSGAYSIASAAREMGIRTLGVFFTPFDFEGRRRNDGAAASLQQLDASLDMMTVLSNEDMLQIAGDLSQEAFNSIANDVLTKAVRGLLDLVAAMPRLMEREDYYRMLHMPGRALIGSASAAGPFRASIAIARALECPLVSDQNLLNAKAALILLTVAENSLKLGELLQFRNMASVIWPSTTHVAFKLACDKTLQNEVRAAVMVTGISKAPAAQETCCGRKY